MRNGDRAGTGIGPVWGPMGGRATGWVVGNAFEGVVEQGGECLCT